MSSWEIDINSHFIHFPKAPKTCLVCKFFDIPKCSDIKLAVYSLFKKNVIKMGDFNAFEEKMRKADLSQAAIDAFRLNYEQLVAGVTGLVSCKIFSVRFHVSSERRESMCCCLFQVPEDEIEAVQELPYLVDLNASENADLKARLCLPM